MKGSYGYYNADGVYRTVYYVADKGGFRANLKTNEPGTDNQNPADVQVTAYAPPPYYPPPKKYSPPAYPVLEYPPPSYSEPSSYPATYPPKYKGYSYSYFHKYPSYPPKYHAYSPSYYPPKYPQPKYPAPS